MHLQSIANKGKAVSKGIAETLVGIETHKDRGVSTKKQKQSVLLSLRPGKEAFVLILTRRLGEKLIIGDNVTVTILGVKGRQIRIGIDAPRDVTVNREEIFQRIKKEREQLIREQKKEAS